MQSRYYNPDWGRFINADAEGGAVGALLSHNVFLYALNNPVNMIDTSGHWPKWVSSALGVVGGALQIVTGVALMTAGSVSGVGIVLGAALIVNGIATFAAGAGQLANNAMGENVLPEDNKLRTGASYIGGKIGGSKGKKIGAIAYDSIDIGLSVFSPGSGVRTVIERSASSFNMADKGFNLFAKASPFVDEYVVRGQMALRQSVYIPKAWFRALNGVGLANDIPSYTGRVMSIFGTQKE